MAGLSLNAAMIWINGNHLRHGATRMRHRTLAGLFALFLVPVAANAAPYTAVPGAHHVVQSDETWNDASRSRDVPVRINRPADVNGPQPVILLSHGLGGSRAAMTYAAQQWCSAGYVVIALQHPGSDESVWQGVPPMQRMAALKSAMTAEQFVARCRDVSFAIDHLTEMSKPGKPFENQVDLDHIGIAGHSFGAQTVQAIIGQRASGAAAHLLPSMADRRITAAIAFSPAFKQAAGDAQTAFSEVSVPCFHFTGTNDITPIREVSPAERRTPYDAIDADGQYLMTFTDADHAVFSGSSRSGSAAFTDHVHALIDDSSTAFWDAYLRGSNHARQWLKHSCPAELAPAGTFERKDRAAGTAPTTKPAD